MDHRETPPLEPESCHVWWADAEADRPGLYERLDPAEQSRVFTLRREADRRRRAVASVLLRDLAACYTGVPAAEVAISRECPQCGQPHGKPRLTGSLEVSVAHSGRWVALAFCWESPVGVDVEAGGRDIDPDRLADRVLSPSEQVVLAGLAPEASRDGFLRYWTRKEAVAKAEGSGLALPLESVIVSSPGAAPLLLEWPTQPPASAVSLCDLDPGPGHMAAVAVLGPCEAVSEFWV